MKLIFDLNHEKNAALKKRHGIGFEDVVVAFLERRLLSDIKHPNQDRYPNERIAVVAINEYIYAVPYILDGETRFLKTLYPSRKLQKQFFDESKNNENQ